MNKQEYREYQHWIRSVRRSGKQLFFVPDNLIDKEMCLEAVKNYAWAMNCVPDDIKNYSFCFEAVKNNSEALRFVPELLLDREICLEAVRQYGGTLEYVPEELKTVEMCLSAYHSSIHATLFFPEYLLDKNTGNLLWNDEIKRIWAEMFPDSDVCAEVQQDEDDCPTPGR